jgi:hypothetical protein
MSSERETLVEWGALRKVPGPETRDPRRSSRGRAAAAGRGQAAWLPSARWAIASAAAPARTSLVAWVTT